MCGGKAAGVEEGAGVEMGCGVEVVRLDSVARVSVAGVCDRGAGKGVAVATGAGVVSVENSVGTGEGAGLCFSEPHAANSRTTRKEKKIARRFIL